MNIQNTNMQRKQHKISSFPTARLIRHSYVSMLGNTIAFSQRQVKSSHCMWKLYTTTGENPAVKQTLASNRFKPPPDKLNERE